MKSSVQAIAVLAAFLAAVRPTSACGWISRLRPVQPLTEAALRTLTEANPAANRTNERTPHHVVRRSSTGCESGSRVRRGSSRGRVMCSAHDDARLFLSLEDAADKRPLPLRR